MEDFLDKLNRNVLKSIEAFKCLKNPLINQNIIYKIRIARRSLIDYEKTLAEFESNYFSDADNYDNNRFIMSFEGDDIQDEFKPDHYINTYKKVLRAEKIKNGMRLDNSISKTKKICNIDGIDLQGNILDLPVVDSLKSLQPAIQWYNGDNFYQKGIYICLCKGFYVKIPFPNIPPPSSLSNRCSKDNEFSSPSPSKEKTLKCKYITRQKCQEHKKKIYQLYDAEYKECTYVHRKEQFNKVSSIFRCPTIETFGRHETIGDDMKKIQNQDIRHLLMYSLSDDLLAILWYQNTHKDTNLVFTNIDIFL